MEPAPGSVSFPRDGAAAPEGEAQRQGNKGASLEAFPFPLRLSQPHSSLLAKATPLSKRDFHEQTSCREQRASGSARPWGDHREEEEEKEDKGRLQEVPGWG